MNLQRDLHELVNAEVISSETADKIKHYYQQKKPNSSNRLFIAFGILGALLVGLGIILILAHNWDELSRLTKTTFAFLPLIIGQGLCAFTLFKKQESVTWRESSSIFLFFAVGASIALISQIYNLPGSMHSFLFIWALLVLPIMYVMRSSAASLFYLMGITWYGCEMGYGSSKNSFNFYWLLLLAGLPYYYWLYKRAPQSNFMTFHNWVVPGSLIITLGTLSDDHSEFMFIAYISLLGLYYLIGNFFWLKDQPLFKNGYRVLGALGTIGILLALSFDWFWEDLRATSFNFSDLVISSEFFASAILSIVAGIIFIRQLSGKSIKDIQPIAPVFLLFIPIFLIGMTSSIPAILINLLVFGIGVLTIRKGGNENHLGILNYGLMIITALIFCRFFDTDLSFVWRGLLFVAAGIGFFLTNYWMIQKRKTNGL